MKGIAMDEDEHAIFDAARDIPDNDDDGYVTENEININDVIDGTTQIDLSHAGGEFQHIIEEEILKKTSYVYSFFINLLIHLPDRHHRVDPRTRRNCIDPRNEGFKRQMVGIMDAYITWQDDKGLDGLPSPVPLDLHQGTLPIRVVDVFCKFYFVVLIMLS